MCRKTPASGPTVHKLSSASIHQMQQSQYFVAPGAATAAQLNDTHEESDETVSISSSVFRRDDRSKGGRHNDAQVNTSATLLAGEASLRDARLDAQHRLRLLPAALWGGRARLADVHANDLVGAEETEPTTAKQQQQQQQHTFLTERIPDAPAAKEGAGPAATLNHSRGNREYDTSTGRKTKQEDAATVTRKSTLGYRDDGHGPVDGGGGGGGGGSSSDFVLPIGASALFAQAASLKRTAVTASVPLRWQSRVIALSSLRDSFREGATRGSPSMGRRMARRRCRAHCQRIRSKRSAKQCPQNRETIVCMHLCMLVGTSFRYGCGARGSLCRVAAPGVVRSVSIRYLTQRQVYACGCATFAGPVHSFVVVAHLAMHQTKSTYAV